MRRPPQRLELLRRVALLVVAVAVLLLPTAAAIPCFNFATPDACRGQVTDSGICGWSGCGCRAIAPLPPGKVGVAASLEEPVAAGADALLPCASSPPPRAEGRLSWGGGSCSVVQGCRF